MRPIDLEEQKQIQLNILIKVDQFCREKNLRYSLGGGTLLGAVRHKGFIPWDDDIDIMMPRPDYDKFVHSFNGYDEDLTCDAYELNKRFQYICGKIYHNKTIQKEPNTKNNIGIFIDVFPIDGFPQEKKKRSSFLRKLYIWRSLLYFKNLTYNGITKRSCAKLFASIFPTSYINKKAQYLIKKHSFSDSIYNGAVSGIYQEKECYPHIIFTQYTKLMFEGHLFMAIQNYHLYLTQHYGNYMQLPPINKRVPSHTSISYWK